ncbi:SelB C-terminal domain-containing protein, partial [Clostridiaceae bacterium HSG29]|nr:SelB C-terminal domain-containing protein [Clostridiaceae bacterium HSG29]
IRATYYSIRHYHELENNMIVFLKDFHLNNSLSNGVNKEEIRKKIFRDLDKKHFDSLLEISVNNYKIKLNESLVSLFDFKISYNENEKNIYDKISNYYYNAEFTPLKLTEVFEKLNISKNYEIIYTNLINEKKLIRINQSITLHSHFIELSKKLLIDYLIKNKSISLGEFRDLIGSSRKVVMPLMEYFDSINITVRNENVRTLKKGVI